MEDISDRELLEAAAKVAGYELDYSIRPDGKAFYHSDRSAMALADGGWFAALTDDGDALRLAVRLKLDVRFPDDNDMYVDAGDCDAYTVYLIDCGQDRSAATRRAIVRAAAALSKGA